VASIVKSFALSGIDANLVEIETDILYGIPGTTIVGLGDTAIKESKERLQAAILNSKFEFPKKKIIINLAPSYVKKSGSNFDLGMAIGLLIRSGQIKTKNIGEYAFIGELSLNAELRPCRGILSMVIAAKKIGIKNVIVPVDNLREASLISDINALGFRKLTDVIKFLKGNGGNVPLSDLKVEEKQEVENSLDFCDVKGQDMLIRYVQIAAAGGHNMLMIGPPGCGKSMIAKRIPTILPKMTEEESLEVTKIFSIAGLLKKEGDLIRERPFKAPHHNASANALIGGGNNASPGEISLAHNGVLFLDEIAEFSKKTLNALRQPIEDGVVRILRVRYTNVYPSEFMLVGAMNPCPCGYYGQDRCRCTDYEILNYRNKISGPIMDRIDIQKYVNSVNFMELSKYSEGKKSEVLREEVEKVRRIQQERYRGIEGVNCNAQMTAALIRKYCVLDKESNKVLERLNDKYGYSARTYFKFLKIARTFADFDGSENIRKIDIINALMSRDIEKEEFGFTVV